MSKTYRSGNPNQQGLPPLSVQDRLPENDPVYFILDTVTELDISSITAKYEQDERCFPPYPPRMMVALLIYAYFRGIFSSRKIMQACQERLTFRAIRGQITDDRGQTSVFCFLSSVFWFFHFKELQQLFVQVLQFCQSAGLVKLENISSDNTEANANDKGHKAMSYCRMEEKQHQHEIHQLLSEAEAVDQQEDQWYGIGCQCEELSEQFGSPKLRVRLTHKRALEAEAEASGEQYRSRKFISILNIPADREIRPPTWFEAARKCIEVYQEVISKYKNCPGR